MRRHLFTLASVASLALCVAACAMWVRSHRVAERWGWATSRPDGPDRTLLDVNVWSAKGGVGVYCEQYRNVAADRGTGSPFFHATDASMDYPYVSVVAAGVPKRRWTFGGLMFSRAVRRREDLSFEVDGARFPFAEAQVSTSVLVPWWLPTAVAAVLPAFAARRGLRVRRARRRARRGACGRCGYDLRASPGRCPECGAEPVTTSQGAG